MAVSPSCNRPTAPLPTRWGAKPVIHSDTADVRDARDVHCPSQPVDDWPGGDQQPEHQPGTSQSGRQVSTQRRRDLPEFQPAQLKSAHSRKVPGTFAGSELNKFTYG